MIENSGKLDPGKETDKKQEWKGIKKILGKENLGKWFRKKGIDIKKIKEETDNGKEELEKGSREAKETFDGEKE
jgi:hypothetical protein